MYGYVYITTNLIDGKKYIGKHSSSIFEPYNYIGSGNYFTKALKKYGKENFKCEVLEWCESKDSLAEREVYWIKYYNAVEDSNFYNLVDSISGIPKGYKYSEESKLRMRKPKPSLRVKRGPQSKEVIAKRALSNSHPHKKYTEEGRLNISRAKKSKKYGPNSLEHNLKISKANSKPIICIETQIIYPSATIASKSLDNKVTSAMIGLCLNGYNKSAGGYHWAYLKDEDRIEKMSLLYKGKEAVKYSGCPLDSRRVLCIETNVIYLNSKEASIQTSSSRTGIRECCRGNQLTSGGYHWKFID